MIGHFGSIYPGKQPNALLDICAILKERGLKPLIVYIGSFIRGVDKVEKDFYARAAELGIIDDVIVSGYVASDHEVFGLFSEIDAFCYPLDEGLTARRSSILACVQSGRPVIVTGPAEPDEFDHHPRFKALIDRGAIVLVARGSDDEVYADRIVSALKWPSGADAVRFRRLVAGCRAGSARAVRRHSLQPEARQIMQAEHRQQKREPESDRRDRGRSSPATTDRDRTARSAAAPSQRSVVAAAVGGLEIPQGSDHQHRDQQRQSRQAHRQRGVEISVMAVRGVFRPFHALGTGCGSNRCPRTRQSHSRSPAAAAATAARRSRCRCGR